MTGFFYGDTPKTDEAPRCWRCAKLCAEIVTRPWRITCIRCKAVNSAGLDEKSPDGQYNAVKDK